MSNELADFPTRLTLPIIWGSMDAYNHVNNTTHIRWFESSRIRYIEEAGLREVLDGTDLGPILASVSCNYKRQLHYPGDVTIGTKVDELGRSSLKLSHIVSNDETKEVAATGESVVVVFDFVKQRPARIPHEIRELISKFEGHDFG